MQCYRMILSGAYIVEALVSSIEKIADEGSCELPLYSVKSEVRSISKTVIAVLMVSFMIGAQNVGFMFID